MQIRPSGQFASFMVIENSSLFYFRHFIMFIPPLSIEITATFLSKAVVVPTKAIVKSCKAKGLQSIRNKSVYSVM